MSSTQIFDLPTRPSELQDASHGMSRGRYRQVTATRDVTGAQFSQGPQQFRFDTGGNTWFLPALSYFRLRCTISQARQDGGALLPPLSSADLAPNMGLAANLFQSAEVQVNGQTVERIAGHLPQIDALKTRTQNTRGWLEHVGRTTNFWDTDFSCRREMLAVDGYERVTQVQEPVYGPALTQVQAGFQPDHTLRYHAGSYILSADHDDVDFVAGPMALRVGDRLSRDNLSLEVTSVIDATHALTKIVHTDAVGRRSMDDGQNPVHGVTGWTIQKLHQAVANRASGKNQFELIWRPPLGFFEVQHAIPPGGSWLVQLHPLHATDYKRNAVESLRDNLQIRGALDGIQAGQFDFEVDELQLYLYTVEADRYDKGSWLLDLEHTRCQAQAIPTDCSRLIQKSFDVHGDTNCLAVAFQDELAGTDTRRSRSKLKIGAGSVEEKGDASWGGQDLMCSNVSLSSTGKNKNRVLTLTGSTKSAMATVAVFSATTSYIGTSTA